MVETSLGYFINPLVSVVLGVVFLHEKLRPAQWVPVMMAAAGVAYLTISHGSLPWLALVGIVTAIPLLLFATGAKNVPLSTLGLLQYISPAIQFLIGVYLYGEPFAPAQLVGFGIIWVALVIFSAESFLARRRSILAPVA